MIVVLPHEMTARTWVSSPIADQCARRRLSTVVVSRDPADADRLRRIGASARWVPLVRPRRSRNSGSRLRDLRHRLADVRVGMSMLLHLMLTYRLNRQHEFVGFRNKLAMARSDRRAAIAEGHPASILFGWPRPSSHRVAALLGRLLNMPWQRHPEVERLFDTTRPDVLVVVHIQNPFIVPYVLAARARGIPAIGVVGSWDQPTTKGPVIHGLQRIIAQGSQIREELERFHGVDASAIDIVGWPQMDLYCADEALPTRDEVLRDLGLPADRRLILFGANPPARRLGAHEVDVVAGLAQRVAAGAFGEDTTLVVRAHPLDTSWSDRFGMLHRPPLVVVDPPDSENLRRLAGLLAQSAVVIATAGTILLDAAALDSGAIGLAYTSDDNARVSDRPERLFETEHFRAVVETGGVSIADSRAELEVLIQKHLEDSSFGAAGRAELRRRHLEPLDGRASERLIDIVVATATAAR